MYTQIIIIIIIIILRYIRMEPTSQNSGINAIKEARKLFNSVEVIFHVKKQMKLEKSSIERKQSLIY